MIAASTRLILLLGADLGPDAPAPLNPASLERVLAWAKNTQVRTDEGATLKGAPVDAGHLAALLGREAMLDRALSDWARAGFWVIGRDDAAYPKRLKRRLRAASPALLFGHGDPALLNRGGIALVTGTSAEAESVSQILAVLGDAGLTTLLELGTGYFTAGPVILIASDGSLGKEPGAAGGTRVGLTPPGTAGIPRAVIETCRYGLADAALLIGLESGDPAWAGAVAAIGGDTLPVWIAGTETQAAPLVRLGARLLPPGAPVPADLLRPQPSPAAKRTRAAGPEAASGFAEAQAGFGPRPAPSGHLRLVADSTRGQTNAGETSVQAAGQTLYDLFETRLAALLSHGPLGVLRIAETMVLTRPQTEAWLMRAQAAGRVRLDPETGLFASDSG